MIMSTLGVCLLAFFYLTAFSCYFGIILQKNELPINITRCCRIISKDRVIISCVYGCMQINILLCNLPTWPCCIYSIRTRILIFIHFIYFLNQCFSMKKWLFFHSFHFICGVIIILGRKDINMNCLWLQNWKCKFVPDFSWKRLNKYIYFAVHNSVQCL